MYVSESLKECVTVYGIKQHLCRSLCNRLTMWLGSSAVRVLAR